MKVHSQLANLLIFMMVMTDCQGEKFTFGTCPTVTAEAGILVNLIATTYREYARTPSIHFQGLTCSTYTFTAVTVGSEYALTVTSRHILSGVTKSLNGRMFVSNTVVGAAAAINTGASTIFALTIPNSKFAKTIRYVPLRISAAFVVLYSCENVGLGKIESVIILVSTTATTANINTAVEVMRSTGYPRHALKEGYSSC